jgi:hypothetical protein
MKQQVESHFLSGGIKSRIWVRLVLRPGGSRGMRRSEMASLTRRTARQGYEEEEAEEEEEEEEEESGRLRGHVRLGKGKKSKAQTRRPRHRIGIVRRDCDRRRRRR